MGEVPDSTLTLGLDYTRLMISDSELSLISGTYDLSLKLPVNDKFNLIAELPITDIK